MWTIRVKTEEGRVMELERFAGTGAELLTHLSELPEEVQDSLESIIRLPE